MYIYIYTHNWVLSRTPPAWGPFPYPHGTVGGNTVGLPWLMVWLRYCVYMYIYTHILVYMYMYIHTHIYTHKYINRIIYIYMLITWTPVRAAVLTLIFGAGPPPPKMTNKLPPNPGASGIGKKQTHRKSNMAIRTA